MIHSVSCNSRDCPWYRRGSKCSHLLASSREIAKLSRSGIPQECPIRKEADIIVSAPRLTGVSIDFEAIESSVKKQMEFWSYFRSSSEQKEDKGDGSLHEDD